MGTERLPRKHLYMRLAYAYSLRSTCERGQVGSVIILGKHPVAFGYNGAPPGADHCIDVGCDMSEGDELGCQRTVHAEANAIAHAARLGIQIDNGTCYSTHSPCKNCAVLLATAGIKAVIYDRSYRRTPWNYIRAELGMKLIGIGEEYDGGITGSDRSISGEGPVGAGSTVVNEQGEEFPC